MLELTACRVGRQACLLAVDDNEYMNSLICPHFQIFSVLLTFNFFSVREDYWLGLHVSLFNNLGCGSLKGDPARNALAISFVFFVTFVVKKEDEPRRSRRARRRKRGGGDELSNKVIDCVWRFTSVCSFWVAGRARVVPP